jgi:hypothetical protein
MKLESKRCQCQHNQFRIDTKRSMVKSDTIFGTESTKKTLRIKSGTTKNANSEFDLIRGPDLGENTHAVRYDFVSFITSNDRNHVLFRIDTELRVERRNYSPRFLATQSTSRSLLFVDKLYYQNPGHD